MFSSADEIERIGIHDLQRAWPEREDSRHGFADLFEAEEMNQCGQRGFGFLN